MSLPNIIQQINSKVPITGNCKITGGNFIIEGGYNNLQLKTSSNNTYTDIAFLHTDNIRKGFIRSVVGDYNQELSIQVVDVVDGSTKYYSSLILGYNKETNNSYAKIGDANIITSAGGTMTGNLVFNGVANTGLRCSNNTSRLSMLSSNTWDSSCIHLWGCANDGNYPGCVEIIPRIGTDNYTVWRFTPEGELQKATNPIHYIVTTYKGSNNWYRIWDDGFIEQGGYLKGTANNQSTTVTLPKGFSNTTYHIVTNFEYTQQSGAYYGYLCAYSKTTTTFKTMLYKDNTGYTTWYACGY